MPYKPCHPSSEQKCDKSNLNFSDHKPTQLIVNRPVAVPSTCCTFQEFVDYTQTCQTSCCLRLILAVVRLFILTTDSHYNVPSETKIISTWNLRKDLHDICTGNCIGLIVFVFLRLLKIQCACVTLCSGVTIQLFIRKRTSTCIFTFAITEIDCQKLFNAF